MPPSKYSTIIFRIHLNFMNGAVLALLFPVTNTRLVSTLSPSPSSPPPLRLDGVTAQQTARVTPDVRAGLASGRAGPRRLGYVVSTVLVLDTSGSLSISTGFVGSPYIIRCCCHVAGAGSSSMAMRSLHKICASRNILQSVFVRNI